MGTAPQLRLLIAGPRWRAACLLAALACGAPAWGAEPVRLSTLPVAQVRETVLRPDGHWKLVNVWASWCAPCLPELPDVADLAQRFHAQGLEVVTLSLDAPQDAERARAILEAAKVAATHYRLDTSDTDALAAQLPVRWRGDIPFTLVLEPDGKVAYARGGPIDADEMRRELAKRLPAAEESRIDAGFAGLVDGDGKSVGEATFAGRYRLVVFGFTHCVDVCPLTLQAVKRTLERLGDDADRVRPVFVTVDPERDVQPALARYASAFDRRILGLSGSADAIARVAAHYGVVYVRQDVPGSALGYAMVHTTSLALVAPDQRVIAIVKAEQPPEKIADAVIAALQADRAAGPSEAASAQKR